MSRDHWLVGVGLLATGCAAIAGLDDEYVVGSTATGTAAAGGAAGAGAQGGSGALAGHGGTGTGTGGGASGGGASGGGGTEDCLNGVDDDGDLAIDCDDSECSGAGYVCVPAATGATSHVALVGSAAECAAPGVVIHFASCQGCSCNDAGGTCSVQLTVWYSSGCPGGGQSVSSTGCTNQYGSVDHLYFDSATTAQGDASCSPQAAQVPAAQTPACEVASPGWCDGGSACVPPSFAAVKTCVVLPPSTACPPEYPEERPVAVGGNICDCACQQGSQQCGTVSVISYSALDCTGTPNTVPLTAPCTYAGQPPSIHLPATVPATVSCTASGSVADPLSTGTLCCRP